jgi:flagellar protein FlgJ
MASGIGITGGVSALTGGYQAAQSARVQQETGVFQTMLAQAVSAAEQKQTSEVTLSTRLNGDYTSGFAGTFTADADKHAFPRGAAATVAGKTIDRTSELYEKSLELESYFVKIMLSSMRSTVTKTNLGGEENSFAQDMYEDMLYDEYAVSLTKNAGFGLADQIYLELAGK